MSGWSLTVDWMLLLRLGVGLPLALGAWVVAHRLLTAGYLRVALATRTRIASGGGLRIQGQTILDAAALASAASLAMRFAYWALVLALVVVGLNLVFLFIPATAPLAGRALALIAAGIARMAAGVASFYPILISLVLIVAVTWAILWVLRRIFDGLAAGLITLPGFPPEWHALTYKLLRFAIVALAVLIGVQSLPIADTAAFKGASLFLGIVLSVGSTVVVAQFMSGVVLTYTDPFRIGDYISVAGHTGTVVERTLFVTRVRTVKDVEVAIPNALVLGSPVLNWSVHGRQQGVVMHTSVTIGYATPWRQVHQLLLDAAAATKGIEVEPAPYVLQRALNDFYVEYQLNVYTRRPSEEPRLMSRLHQAVQDAFFEAGVEIMSPHYAALRDGNRAEVPAANLPAGYRPPGFRVDRD